MSIDDVQKGAHKQERTRTEEEQKLWREYESHQAEVQARYAQCPGPEYSLDSRYDRDENDRHREDATTVKYDPTTGEFYIRYDHVGPEGTKTTYGNGAKEDFDSMLRRGVEERLATLRAGEANTLGTLPPEAAERRREQTEGLTQLLRTFSSNE
jgi:hypothetical protein